MNRRYYKVTCKAGHVGRNNFIRISFYIVAPNGKKAAEIAREMPRVKHDQKDCILDVKEIDKFDYILGRHINDRDPYLLAQNIQEQKRSCEDIWERIERESFAEQEFKIRKERNKHGIKEPKRYSKMNPVLLNDEIEDYFLNYCN